MGLLGLSADTAIVTVNESNARRERATTANIVGGKREERRGLRLQSLGFYVQSGPRIRVVELLLEVALPPSAKTKNCAFPRFSHPFFIVLDYLRLLEPMSPTYISWHVSYSDVGARVWLVGKEVGGDAVDADEAKNPTGWCRATNTEQ